ncbi:MAG: NlpC/P60 family protein [Actinomycetota bacterium]|nr:NlpC/P60 family protein [Actinomycetota bacterium]
MGRRVATVFLATLILAVAVGAFAWDRAEGETYEQVVDNSDKGRFAASKSWKKSDSGEGVNGSNYRFALPTKRGAHPLFKVNIPADGEYAVYARWPEVPGLNDAARVGVETTYGTQWTEVNQRENGGRWVRVGLFEMREGDDYSVKISRGTDGEGNVVADAVKVVSISSYDEEPEAPSTEERRSASAASEQRTASAAGNDVVQEARRYLGTPYRLGGDSACQPFETMDCSCLTSTVYRKFGESMPDDPTAQFRYGRDVSGALSPGDLVFFREDGETITHVGIYSGNGRLVHASSHFGEAVESEMRYIPGYAGARRLL